MKIRFILNPRSGRNARRPRLAGQIREFIARRGLDATLVATTGPGHATELAREAVAAGCERVVAVGGDGTMNEIAQALVHTSATLALVPCGSGNGLARHLGLPTSVEQAIELAANREADVATIDTGIVNGLPFFNAMGSGFDAEISRRFNHLKRRGLPAYVRTTLIAFWRRRTEQVVIHAGGHSLALETLIIAVANSEQYGNGALIAPGARVDDGALDLIAVRPVGFVTCVPLIARLFLGSLRHSSRIVSLCGARFTVERPSPGLIHTDGETHTTGATLEIEVRPRSLRLLVPAHRPARAPHRPAVPVTADLPSP